MAQEPHRKRKREDEETLSLYGAIRQEKLETVQQLLEEKAEVSGAKGGLLLYEAVLYNKNPEIVITLLKAKADPNHIDRASGHSQNILQRAIAYDKPRMVSALLTYKASLHHRGVNGYNALGLATIYSHTDIVKLLLAAKADTTTDSLRTAAGRGDTAIIKLLLENQADIHSQDEDQHTALSEAAIAGREEVVSQLLAAKASAQMPLHHMLSTPLLEWRPIKGTIVLALIKAKASCRLKDGHGKSALDLVRQHKSDDKITQLIEKCYEREAGLAFLSGLHPRTGASSLLTRLSQRSSLFDRQVLRIPLKLAASTPDPNPAPRRGK